MFRVTATASFSGVVSQIGNVSDTTEILPWFELNRHEISDCKIKSRFFLIATVETQFSAFAKSVACIAQLLRRCMDDQD